MDLKIVAVTACVSGVAHTYMAAERLQKVGHHEKWQIKIETQGALGIENKITPTILPGPMSSCWSRILKSTTPGAFAASARLKPASKRFYSSRSRSLKR
jgi:hypothetical protein